MKNHKNNIYVTRPFLPPLEELLPSLEKIWQSRQLTNSSPFHQEFEHALAGYLDVPHVSLFANATIALVTALQSLRITGEVITTPYSFVATAHSLLWNNIKPVFADIDPISLNLDPKKIEEAITPQTTAIMPVHVYGRPCNVSAIQEIADIYGLRVIYDAAHAFGVSYQGESLLKHGDLSILSFHATKVFSTFEGGAIICRNAKIKQRIDFLKNFGFADEVTVVAPGINGKMNEFQAALGLLQLKHIDNVIASRRAIYDQYSKHLSDLNGIRILEIPDLCRYNYSYFPIFVGPDYPLTRDELYQKFKKIGIYPRRYFYPLISQFPMYRGLLSAKSTNLPIAESISKQVICLPIYPDLQSDQIDLVVSIVTSGK